MAPASKKNSQEHEPTLHDVLSVLQITNQKIDGVKAAVLVVNERMDSVEVRMSTMERNQEKLKGAVADIQEDLTSALAAFDHDAEAVLDHEKRIVRLERSSARA